MAFDAVTRRHGCSIETGTPVTGVIDGAAAERRGQQRATTGEGEAGARRGQETERGQRDARRKPAAKGSEVWRVASGEDGAEARRKGSRHGQGDERQASSRQPSDGSQAHEPLGVITRA